MIASATKSSMVITDLSELEDLMKDIGGCDIDITNDPSFIDEHSEKLMTHDHRRAKGTITSRVLRWGI